MLSGGSVRSGPCADTLRGRPESHATAGPTHTSTRRLVQVQVEPWLRAEPGPRNWMCNQECVIEPAALAVERRIGPGPHSSPASLGERQYSAFLGLPIRPGAFHIHFDKKKKKKKNPTMFSNTHVCSITNATCVGLYVLTHEHTSAYR